MADHPDDRIPVDAVPFAEFDAVRAKLAAAEDEVANYKLRLADFENARKRMLRDADAQRKFAAEGLIRDLLGALDNLERALAAAKVVGDTGPLAVGVSATASQFLEVLKRYGVAKIEAAAGTVFDPNVHQAVSQQPTNDYEPGAVTQVVGTGFTLHDKVLRPAMVVVATAPPAGGSNE
ncbi:MAG TPA: nucleotide exchange factor GrpE [Urbifossiella sp.]|nr:nucleotide exchange factor GrpE [Urbifossiella sp.]